MRKRISKEKRAMNTRISEKIEKLRGEENLPPDEAAGMAYGMERAHRLGRHGVYHRVGKRSKRSSRR